MILLLGDIHGDSYILQEALEVAKESNAVAIIQLGDFGLFDDTEYWFRAHIQHAHIPIYFIDGNHDDCSRWDKLKEVTRIWDDRNLYYVPRGTVMKLDGRTVACMGGAASIDKKIRLEHHMHWDANENIGEEQIANMFKNAEGKTIDMFLTHCPPNSVINEHFDPIQKLRFGVGLDWHDQNQDIIEDIWKKLGHPPIYSGHMHKKIIGMTYRILDINELLAV